MRVPISTYSVRLRSDSLNRSKALAAIKKPIGSYWLLMMNVRINILSKTPIHFPASFRLSSLLVFTSYLQRFVASPMSIPNGIVQKI